MSANSIETPKLPAGKSDGKKTLIYPTAIVLFGVLFSASLVCYYRGSQAAARQNKAYWYLAF